MCGLTAARILQNAGHTVMVVDKGRGVGGRMATRRIDDAVFDHGAQFLTARSEWFASLVAEWQGAGIVVPWFSGESSDAHVRYRGAPSMNAIAKHLAVGLDVRTSTTVTSIRRSHRCWRATMESGSVISTDACILTAPVPQALALIDSGEIDANGDSLKDLEQIRYDPCLAVMCRLEGSSNLPSETPLRPPGSDVIALISDNQSKGVSPSGSITIHSTAEFALKHLEDPPGALGIMVSEAQRYLQQTIVSAVIHRWRYAQPASISKAPFSILNTAPPLLIAGDAFGGARIEGAAISGRDAAAHIITG